MKKTGIIVYVMDIAAIILNIVCWIIIGYSLIRLILLILLAACTVLFTVLAIKERRKKK